ncbi:MAG: hypothetical protein O7G87_24285 [bacterium]|nr:hypothetical protein [bacterium]
MLNKRQIGQIPYGQIVLLFLCCLLGAAWAFQPSKSLSGVLDAGGGSGRGANYILKAGSLGQPIQTGRLLAGSFELRTGFLLPSKPKPVAEVVLGDFNGDRAVDFADFLLFAGGFGRLKGEEGYDDRFDLDGDGQVNFPDFLVFATAFGA